MSSAWVRGALLKQMSNMCSFQFKYNLQILTCWEHAKFSLSYVEIKTVSVCIHGEGVRPAV